MSSSQEPKRARFDATADIPANQPSTPMGAGKEAIKNIVESLRPELATILLRLGNEFLLCLHKEISKSKMVKKLEVKSAYILISARVKFALNKGSLLEKDEDYINLVSGTQSLVKNFQSALKKNILEATKIEVKKLKELTLENYVKALRMLVQASLTCNIPSKNVNIDKFLHTLLLKYPTILKHVGEKEVFLAAYKRLHTLDEIPPAYVTEIPTVAADDGSTAVLPASYLLNQIPKTH